MKLPVKYSSLSSRLRKAVRLQYIAEQDNKCMYCGNSLSENAPLHIRQKKINWSLFPPGFLNNSIHLQHNHTTDMTEGTVHSYCNAVLWQYEGK
jgi:hypothetical protein